MSGREGRSNCDAPVKHFKQNYHLATIIYPTMFVLTIFLLFYNFFLVRIEYIYSKLKLFYYKFYFTALTISRRQYTCPGTKSKSVYQNVINGRW